MQAYNGHGALLLLLLFILFDRGSAVCRHCWGTIPGCPGRADDDGCTSLTGVAANVGALVAGAAATVSCVNLLPLYLLRVFTRRVLDVLTQVARRGSGAVAYVFTGKGPDEIIQAVADRIADADDAIIHLGVTAAASATTDALRNQCVAATKVIESLRGGRLGAAGARVDFGRYLYIFSTVQQYVATSVGDALTLGDSAAEKSGSPPTAKLRVPSSADVFYESLTLWIMVCHATGAANALIATRFVHESVHLTVRRLGFSWMVAFELFVLYLERVDIPDGVVLNLSTVLAQGGLDTLLAQANINGAVRFGSSFRSQGGGGAAPDRRPTGGGGGGGVAYNGRGSSRADAGICATFNFGRDHKPSELNPDGSCKKRHVCNHYVNDKGKLGRCEGDHIYGECTNPAGCSKAVAEALA